MTQSGVVSSLSITSFYKITNERGTKTVFTNAHVKWFYGESERAYYLNYFINLFVKWISIYFQSYHLPLPKKREPFNLKSPESYFFNCYFFLGGGEGEGEGTKLAPSVI